MTLNSDAATICSQATPRGMAALRPCSRINANRDSALIENPKARSVHTLISANAIVMIGQLRPQTKARRTSSSFALVISSNPCGEATNHLYEIAGGEMARATRARCGTLVQSCLPDFGE